MKTIQFTGTESDILDITDNLSKRLKAKQSETRVYVIDTFNVRERDWNSLTDDEFITLVEEDGNIYSLEGFQDAFNNSDINTEIDVVRFISAPLF